MVKQWRDFEKTNMHRGMWTKCTCMRRSKFADVIPLLTQMIETPVSPLHACGAATEQHVLAISGRRCNNALSGEVNTRQHIVVNDSHPT